MQGQTAVVLGATGLVGSHLVEGLIRDNSFSSIRVLVRRSIRLKQAKLQVEVIDFENLAELKSTIGKGHSLFCCVGTTQKKVKGDKKAYRKVDYDIPANSAAIAAENGFANFLLVSSAGADPASKNFYLQLKGEVEAEISKQNLAAVHIFRPGFLLGDRQESRPAEWFGKKLMKAFGFLLLGKLNRYKAIHANEVAKAMISAAKSGNSGVNIYHNAEIKELAKG